MMTTSTYVKAAASTEERFLLECLRRLHSPDQRYLFTLIADLVSVGLASTKRQGRKGASLT